MAVEGGAPQTDPVYALPFPDGLKAADFLVALRDTAAAVAADASGSASGGGTGELQAWIDSPLAGGGREACCVYVTAAALDAARRSAIPLPHAEPVNDPRFPAGRILVVEGK